jgi:hypothetical protein
MGNKRWVQPKCKNKSAFVGVSLPALWNAQPIPLGRLIEENKNRIHSLANEQ